MILNPVVVGYQLVKCVFATKIPQNPWTNATQVPAKKRFLFKEKKAIIGITAIRQEIPVTNSFQKAIPISAKLKGYCKTKANTILHRKLTAINRKVANTVIAILANFNLL